MTFAQQKEIISVILTQIFSDIVHSQNERKVTM